MTARIERPLSPHLQTYRWTLTMALSIVHRATGMALYFGTLLLAWWLIAAATGPAAYANVQAFTSSFIGRLIVFGYTWALLHHLLSGLRHFVWDLGYGFKASEREALTWGALIEDRRYRPSMPRAQAYEILCGMRGKLESPLVTAFKEVALNG